MRFSPAWDAVKLTLKVCFICPFVVIDPTDLGATIVVAQALCLTSLVDSGAFFDRFYISPVPPPRPFILRPPHSHLGGPFRTRPQCGLALAGMKWAAPVACESFSGSCHSEGLRPGSAGEAERRPVGPNLKVGGPGWAGAWSGWHLDRLPAACSSVSGGGAWYSCACTRTTLEPIGRSACSSRR